MTYSNIEGKFYPLQTDEYVRACKELTYAQKDVFYYLKTLDPFGDRFIEIDANEVAKHLRISKFTVYKSIRVLGRLGWLELEAPLSRIRLKMTTSIKCNECERQTVRNCSGAIINSSGAIVNSSGAIANSSGAIVEQLEPLLDKGFGSPHTNKTIKTSKTLSLPEKEREKFLEFANKKVDELPKRPQLPKKWIEKNHDELWAEYQELEQRKEANEQRTRESIDQQQGTVVDPSIAAALENGEILEIDKLYKMFRVQEGWWHWHELDQWRAKQSMADYQQANEAMFATKQLIAKSADIPI